MQQDARGLELSTDSAEAARLLDQTQIDNLEYRSGTAATLKALLAEDPEFVHGQTLKGYLLMLFGSDAFLGKVSACLEFCRPRLNGVSQREADHVSALDAWHRGDLRRAERLWDQILIAHPRDLLALRLQHFANFYMGRSQGLRDAMARVLPAWDEAVPGYSFVLGMYAFGLEESGDFPAAEHYGRRSVALNDDDLWARHAVAHVLEMQGRLKEGLAWLDQPLDLWDDRNAFKEHLWWHRALYAYELGNFDQVLDLYDRAVRRDLESDFYLNLVNAASLLWRLTFARVEVGDRWTELAETCATRIEDHALAFSDVHFMMALAAGGQTQVAEAQLSSMRAYAARCDNTSAETMTPVAIPLAEGILACAQGDYDRAIDLMMPIRDDHACLGGSHAQRDIFKQFLIIAALGAGRLDMARGLLAERVAAKPNSVPSWQAYARVLTDLGDQTGADQAKRRSDDVRSGVVA